MDTLTLAKQVIAIEAKAISTLADKLDAQFDRACQALLACRGRVIVIGMGKSGHIGSKIAATFASTGTPAFFVHPGEASHGDLGMITEEDVVILISNSGEAEEILFILPILKRLDITLIGMTGNLNSSLGKNVDIHLDIGVTQEACPLNLAPTSSTTATLVMGDALAISLLETRGFTKEDFARAHPAGSLGRKLLTVADIMHSGDALPQVVTGTTLGDALIEMSNKRLGMVAITGHQGEVLGVFTDGDLRRALTKNPTLSQDTIDTFMSLNPASINADSLVEQALQLMEQKNINGLLVMEQQQLVGALNMLDLVHAKIL